MSKIIDLTGKRFGRLVVIKWVGKDKWRHRRWLCKCDCKNKNEIIVTGGNLRNGNTKSCGCLQKEIMSVIKTTHGHVKTGRKTKIYMIWVEMIQRCTNPNHKQWDDYGGRGITVCDEWMEFPNFLKDNPDWKLGLTIERISNKLGYFKDNCYWATRKEQGRNKRNNLYITYGRKTQLLIEWSEETGIPYHTLYARIYKYNWSSEKALTTSVRRERKS